MKKTTLLLFLILSSISFLQMDCKDEPPVTVDPPPTGPDTTSHNFTWTTYTFGGNAGSSYFKDVAIINDSNIWAVGAINTSPETTYNAAHWDGKKWNLKKIFDADNLFIGALRGIFSFGNNDIWLTDGGIHLWNAGSQHTSTSYSRIALIGGVENGQSVDKLWGINTIDIFGVGQKGMITHFNGTDWIKQESGTTIDLRDVWGSADGKSVWACGWSNDNTKSILLKYDGSIWKTIWIRDGLSSVPPYEYFATSVWGGKSLYLSTGRGVFHVTSSETTKAVILPWFPYRIRGSNENNIATSGDEGMIWHFNGANWKELHSQTDQAFYSIDVLKNMIVAVGSENAIGFGAALVSVGQRN